MFTGIIEAVGTIRAIIPKGEDIRIDVGAGSLDMFDVQLGDSIATNGVCLTVIHKTEHSYQADLSLETLNKSAFARAQAGDLVNLEKAMLPTTRFGGHIVSGHVDGVGEVIERTQSGRAIEFWIKMPAEIARYIAEKGSVTVDGISLTVNAVRKDAFRLTIIPHTSSETTIQSFMPGRVVNLEVDIMARYLERLIESKSDVSEKDGNTPASSVTLEFLQQNGFA
ncbi:Riboflavin synthase [Vibrio aerogenes CECT 7868]|uniref:Riboflavin synthase n=1 Tax=Vibrio aerogenes CECT 7868 TaxID=1216006 RepID=A0A1M5WI95_9VIBR|nr:riboflavin synthase [Vibrio aerogenes]SHH87216.1 Riboflavin synthase [Vibrio aerogenes CECT 7868]